MHSKRLLDLLVIGLSALSVAEATFVNGRVNVRNVKAIEQRQAQEDTPTPNATNSETNTPTPAPTPSSTPPAPKPSSQPPTTPTEPSTPAPDTTSKTTPPPNTPTSNKPDTPTTTSSTQPPAGDTTPAPNPPSQQPSKPVVKTITTIVETVTNGDGSKSTRTSEVVTTATPGLAENNSNGGGSGMAPETRNTIIGVCVGVGGAIVLIALGFVAWRIWGRKKNQDEGLMDYSTPNDGKSEVGGSMSGRTPFQSTLESYHAPTQVNQAANF